MLLSMTGQGQGRKTMGASEVSVEVRAVNNRHLKLQTRVSECLSGLEPEIEALIRSSLRRGSLQLNVQVSGHVATSNYRLQEAVVAGYVAQCQQVAARIGMVADLELGDLLQLPGVIVEGRGDTEIADDLKQLVLETVEEALSCLNRMRRAEGESMATELSRQLDQLTQITDQIEQRAPSVVEEYRQRLQGRLIQALAEVGAKLQETDVVREVLLMADKADVREEIVRLRSHITQFRSLLTSPESQGRKLDFLIQEMFRETNTIGSKASDAQIAQRVVDVKTAIEQMRELVQNVE